VRNSTDCYHIKGCRGELECKAASGCERDQDL
jgi:hypothetical protein